MPDVKTTLTRAELFDLVWSKPAIKVAADYGVSSVAVAKACRRLEVPTPPRGYWTKLAHGKVMRRPKLPPRKDGERDTTTLGEALKVPRTAAPDTAIKEEVAVPDQLHPIVQKTRAAFRAGVKDRHYGTLHAKREIPHLRISVTTQSLDRAIAILNRLAWLLDKNGFLFEVSTQGNETVQVVYAATRTEINFSLQEPVERYERELTEEERKRSWIWDRWLYRPTARLKIVLAEYEPKGGRKSWSDGKGQKLEEKLTDIVEGFIVCAREKHADHLRRQEQRRRWEEECRLREEAAKARQEEERQRNLFRDAALRWSEANVMREFQAACEKRLRAEHADGKLTAEEESWLVWAASVVDLHDPLRGPLSTGSVAERLGVRHCSTPGSLNP